MATGHQNWKMNVVLFQSNQPHGSTTPVQLTAEDFSEQIFILSLDPIQKIAVLSFICVSIGAGIIYQALLLKNVWEEGMLSRPINFMTGNL